MIDVDAIKQANDLRQLIMVANPGANDHNYKRLWCPFCQQGGGAYHKAPALEIYRDDTFHCFGCARSGDAITFVQMRDRVDFRDACRILGANDAEPITPQEAAQKAIERAERAARELEKQIKEAQEALKELRETKSWEKYYRNDDKALIHWQERGLDEFFYHFWQLGYCEDFALWRKDGSSWTDYWHSPTISFPVWGQDWTVNNVKHRLLRVPDEGGKYRQETTGVPAAPFVANPDVKSGALFVAEGEIKSMVVFKAVDDPNLQVIGLPSAIARADMLEPFGNYEPVYICLDPDAYHRKAKGVPSPIERAVETIGKERARVIILPDKIDDAINAGLIDKDGMHRLMAMARKA